MPKPRSAQKEGTQEDEANLQVPVQVLDRRRWLGRAFYFDVLAVVALPLAALGLGFDLYTAGYLRSFAPAANPDFAPLIRVGLELLVFGASYAWIAARLLRAGFRELPAIR